MKFRPFSNKVQLAGGATLLIVAFWAFAAFNELFPNASCTDSPLNKASSSSPSYLIENFPIRGPLSWSVLNDELKREFLLQGKISLEIMELFNMEPFLSGQPFSYSKTLRREWTLAGINELVETAKKRDINLKLCVYGKICNRDFFNAFEVYPIEGKEVMVLGSQSPWAEALCIAFGAKSVTTVDFNPPSILEGPSPIKIMNAEDLGKFGETFDVIVSYSSLEHDGLGRYGDPVHPYGDIERMKKLSIKQFLRPGGLFFLAVPMGADVLTWNAHRVYGEIRFPLLIDGWKVVQTIGDLEWTFRQNATHHHLQPIHVLQAETQ